MKPKQSGTVQVTFLLTPKKASWKDAIEAIKKPKRFEIAFT